MLELKNISKSYENKPLLKDISFTVKAGETICLLGASGSGKSTLLRIIAGLESPDEGMILFNGMDLAGTPAHARGFGMVFQDYGLFPHLNVFDNIAFGLKMKRMPLAEIKQRVANLLKQINLIGFENRKVHDLSGGEQQRVALARALAPRPHLLMFDEPLGALDQTLKDGLLNELRAILHKAKIPAIYVTHDQEEAFAIADRILLLHNGQIIRQGTPQEIWSDPGSSWTARFLGAGNILDGMIVSTKKVRTEFAIFDIDCGHKHKKGEKIPLLLKECPTPFGKGAKSEAGTEIKLKVKDVLFKREQFQVRTRGGLIIHMKEKPRVGEIVRVCMKAECLA